MSSGSEDDDEGDGDGDGDGGGDGDDKLLVELEAVSLWQRTCG